MGVKCEFNDIYIPFKLWLCIAEDGSPWLGEGALWIRFAVHFNLLQFTKLLRWTPAVEPKEYVGTPSSLGLYCSRRTLEPLRPSTSVAKA